MSHIRSSSNPVRYHFVHPKLAKRVFFFLLLLLLLLFLLFNNIILIYNQNILKWTFPDDGLVMMVVAIRTLGPAHCSVKSWMNEWMNEKSIKFLFLSPCTGLAHPCLWLLIDFSFRTAKAQPGPHQTTIFKSPVSFWIVYHSDKSPGRCVFFHVEKYSWAGLQHAICFCKGFEVQDVICNF